MYLRVQYNSLTIVLSDCVTSQFIWSWYKIIVNVISSFKSQNMDISNGGHLSK